MVSTTSKVILKTMVAFEYVVHCVTRVMWVRTQLFSFEEKPKDMLEDLNNEGKGDGMKLNKKKNKNMCSEWE